MIDIHCNSPSASNKTEVPLAHIHAHAGWADGHDKTSGQVRDVHCMCPNSGWPKFEFEFEISVNKGLLNRRDAFV